MLNSANNNSFSDLVSVYIKTIDHLNLKLLIFVGILQILRFDFKKFSILEILNFHPWYSFYSDRNQVHWNIYGGVLQHTPSSEVVWSEESHDLFQNKMLEHTDCMYSDIFYL